MEEWIRSAGLGVLIVLAVALVVLFATAVVLLVRLVRMMSVVRSDDMPLSGKITFWAALVYTVFPIDVLMDPIYLDDVGVLAGALAYLTHLAGKYSITPRPSGDRRAKVRRAHDTQIS
jgi:uncharacterized membrane protein YkvA (DUF1232 family)